MNNAQRDRRSFQELHLRKNESFALAPGFNNKTVIHLCSNIGSKKNEPWSISAAACSDLI
jgi:hypothetical protein